jgi:hypothetical protein
MRWAIVALALAALAWPGTALAKEVKSAAVCGADGCAAAGGGPQFMTLFQDPPTMPGGTAGANVRTILDPVRVQPYYRVVVTLGGGQERTFHAIFFFVPPNLFRAYDHNGVLSIPFRRISGQVTQTVGAAASHLQPFAPPRVLSATIDGKPVAQPRPLISLFAGKPVGDGVDTGPHMATLALNPDRLNPWFSGNTEYLYKPDAEVLLLDRQVKVPRDAAVLLARAGGFPLPSSGGGWSWVRPAGFGLLGGLALLAGAIVFARTRRRPGPATA